MMSEFRVIFVPSLECVGAPFVSRTVGTVQEAINIRDALANYTLLLHDQKLMHDYSNLAVVEKLMDGEWEELSSI